MKLLFVIFALSSVIILHGAYIPKEHVSHSVKDFFESVKFMKLGQKDEERKPCKGHDQFEGAYFTKTEKTKAQVNAISFSYDAINKRTRAITAIYEKGTVKKFNTVILYNQKMMFIVDMNTHHCTNMTVNFPWEPVDIPQNATYWGAAYIGALKLPGQGLLVDSYYGKRKMGDYWAVVTRNGCWMISGAYDRSDIGYMETSFSNLTEGIKDPSVFNIPKECLGESEEVEVGH